MAQLVLRNLNKVYDNGFQAIFDFSLEIDRHDFVVFLGPSGCGKSTILRMIAGLEKVTSGTIEIDGRIVNKIAPSERNLSMVFQNYALYSQMSVYENVGFSLMIRHRKKAEIHREVTKAQEIVKLTDDELRRTPLQLSGGQKQRVAIGRAIAKGTDICLMDEPLSNLDAKLRTHMRSEIKRVFQELDNTFIYVTHDQVEAMTMATKIVVMDKGRIQQIGAPAEIYNRPRNLFVARFIGTSPINLIRGAIEDHRFVFGPYRLDLRKTRFAEAPDCGSLLLGIRPEALRIVSEGDYDMTAQLVRSEFLGSQSNVYLTFEGQNLQAVADPSIEIGERKELRLRMDRERIVLFDEETTLALTEEMK